MTKLEALQKFASHVDLSGMMDDFPEIDWVVTELDDGQQETIVRLQGEDVDFRPAGDYTIIDAVNLADFRLPVVPEAGLDDPAYLAEFGAVEASRIAYFPTGVSNTITLRRAKRARKLKRKNRFENAIFKRIKALIAPAGISVQRLIKILQTNLPVEEVEL